MMSFERAEGPIILRSMARVGRESLTGFDMSRCGGTVSIDIPSTTA